MDIIEWSFGTDKFSCSPSQCPQLNKSRPTSKRIQADVKENKQALAQTSWTTPRGNMHRAHFLICFAGFRLSRHFDSPLLPSPLDWCQSRGSACHIGRLQLAYNCGYWKRVTMAGTIWKPQSHWTRECWLCLQHIHLDWFPGGHQWPDLDWRMNSQRLKDIHSRA